MYISHIGIAQHLIKWGPNEGIISVFLYGQREALDNKKRRLPTFDNGRWQNVIDLTINNKRAAIS